MMKKKLYYIMVAVGISVLLVSCSDHDLENPGLDEPTIDPPVNELWDKKLFKDVIPNRNLEAYEYKAVHIRKVQEQIEFTNDSAEQTQDTLLIR